MTGAIRTVLGDVPGDSIGPTHGHEHVLFQPVANSDPDLSRTDESRAVAELRAFRSVGGSALVDATVSELGRAPAVLQRISMQSGVGVISATGHTSEDWWDESTQVGADNFDRLTERIIADLVDGMDGTEVRAGIVKVGTSLNRITNSEARVISAAAAAQKETGAPITTHTTAGTAALDQIRALREAGADLTRVCIGHLDRALDWDTHLEIAQFGVFLGYDQISKQRYEADTVRARFIARLVNAGFGGQVLVSSDLARRSDLSAWGGEPGLDHLLKSFVPLLEAEGVAENDIRRILVDNPRRFLSWC